MRFGRREVRGGDARDVVNAAVAALRLGDVGRYRQLLARLATDRSTADVESALADAVDAVRARNWQPREIVRQTDRRLGARHARFVTAVLAGRGGSELVATVEGLACAIEALALLLGLPPLPKLGGSVGTRPRSDDEARMLEKVRALLAKAESTTFPEEAEALSAKAQELMARYALDDAMVDVDGEREAVPGGLRLPVDEPYARAKSVLLHEVAAANRCSAVWSESLGFSTVFGFESDLQFVDVLYTSLLVQATSAMVAAGTQSDIHGRSRTRSFRHAFLLAYARRIGERLRAADAAVVHEYGDAVLPVLADRSAAVVAARDAAYPGTVKRSVSVTNAAGWAAGSAAADLASLSSRTEVSRPA